jgi:hypothetical protein
MAGYAKMWDIADSSRWFSSLRLIERGMWWELIRLCKKNGDTGTLVVQNSRKFAQLVGAEYRTCDKILRDFRKSGKIFTENSSEYGRDVLVIKVCNYHIYQRAKDYTELQRLLKDADENEEKSRKFPDSIAEQSITEQNIQEIQGNFPEKSRKIPQPSQPMSYFLDRWKAKYGTNYIRTGDKDKKVAKIADQITTDQWQEAVDAYLEDRDPFVVKAMHSIEVMLSRINLYLTTKDDPFAETKSRFADLRPDEK